MLREMDRPGSYLAAPAAPSLEIELRERGLRVETD
jgi:hypothetical protein